MSNMQIPVTWDAANRKKDKSVSLRFTTNFEISHEDFSEMDKHVGSIGWLLFKENAFNKDEIPDNDAPAEFTKKPSIRLRNVLYRVWEQQTDMTEDFDRSYYPRIMEGLIDKYKEKLV